MAVADIEGARGQNAPKLPSNRQIQGKSSRPKKAALFHQIQISCKLFLTKCACTNHVTGGHAQGGKTCLHTHFGRSKALFSYRNVQLSDSIGGQNHAKFFIWWAIPPCPLQVLAWHVFGRYTVTATILGKVGTTAP